MLKDKLDGTETKAEIVEYLEHCDCPALKKKFITWTVWSAKATPLSPKVAVIN